MTVTVTVTRPPPPARGASPNFDFRSMVVDGTPVGYEVPIICISAKETSIPVDYSLECLTSLGMLPKIELESLPADEAACREYIREFLKVELEKQAAKELGEALA